MSNFVEQLNCSIQFCFKVSKVDFSCKGVAEVYAKIFHTSCWINFLATYSEVKVFTDSFKFSFKDNYFRFTCIQGYFIAS